MVKLKSHKGEIATLLTLGLVLIGGLITLGLSILSNNQKISMNSRAAETCSDSSIPRPGMACCFCQNGTVRVYASSTARCNAQMSTPCTTAAYGTAYGATSWGYCQDGGTGYEGSCSGGSEVVEEGGEEGTETDECPEPKFTCSSKNLGTDFTEIFSKDDNDIYYNGKNCSGDKIGSLQNLIKKCDSLVTADCAPVGCDLLYGNNAEYQDVDFGNRKVYTKSGFGGTYFNEGCYQKVNPLEECIPEAEVKCEPRSCESITGDSYKDYGDQVVYILPNEVGLYYKDSDCEVSLTINSLCRDLTPKANWNFIGETLTANGTTYYNCIREGGSETVGAFQLRCAALGGVWINAGALGITSSGGSRTRFCCQQN